MDASQLAEFWTGYSEWEGRVRASFHSVTPNADEAALVSRVGINMADMLEAIPGAERRQLINEYRNLIGFDEAIKRHGLRDVDSAGTVRRLNIDPDQIREGNNPVAMMLNRLSVQHDPSRPLKYGLGAEHVNFLGKNIPSAAMAKDQIMGVQRGAQSFLSGSSVFVFDTETTGIATTLGGVREVAGSKFRINAGKLSDSSQFSARFKTPGMEFGSVWDKDHQGGKLRSMAEFFDEGVKGQATGRQMGDEFAEKLIPFLQNIIGSDHIAGHNVEFDIRQTLSNLQRTAAYKAPQDGGINIRQLVDDAFAKIQTPGAVIDTRDLTMQALPNLGLAKELERTGKKAPYSLENILLKTNLAKLMIADPDFDSATFFASAGQHSADYDTTITAHLLKYLATDELKAKDLGRSGLEGIIRANTIKSHAIISTAHITDVNELHPQLFNDLVEGRYGASRFEVAQVGKTAAADSKLDLTKHTPAQVRAMLEGSGQSQFLMRSGVSYLEQEMWQARQTTPAIRSGVTGAEIVGGLGEWRRFSGVNTPYMGMLNRDRTINKLGARPAESQFTKMVNHMADLGNPFANLSVPERILTNAMATASSTQSTVYERIKDLPIGQRRAVELGDDLNIGHFATQTEFDGAKRLGQRVSMPMEVIRHAEDQKALASGFNSATGEMQMLHLSPFESDRGDKVVNLMYQFADQSEADRLADYMAKLTPTTKIGERTIAEMGLESTESIMRYAENIRTSGAEYGVTVGYLDRTAGSILHDVMGSLFGTTRDEGRPRMHVAFAGEEHGVTQVGPVLGDTLMDDAAKLGIRAKVSTAKEQFSLTADYLSSDKNYIQTKAAQSIAAIGAGPLDYAKDFLNTGAWDELYAAAKGSKKTGIAAAGVGLALGGYYFLKRRKNRQEMMEPFETMPIEAQSHREPPMYPGTQQSTMDPMATAGVVGNMDTNRTNHAIMGTAKYSGLFGGAI